MALLVLMLGITVGVAGLLLVAYDPAASMRTERAQASQVRLARAAEALVAYNLDDDWNPGALVCPDTHANTQGGIEVSGIADISCLSSNDRWFRGRLPWRTLDLPREYGRLWYAVDAGFRDDHNGDASWQDDEERDEFWEDWADYWDEYEDDDEDGDENGYPWGSDEPLNPGVSGSLSVDGVSGYAAVIIDPGPPVNDTQTGRPSYEASDYLEEVNLGQASDDESAGFVDCGDRADCNDRTYGITVDRLFEPVQRRVLRELVPLFEAYGTVHGGDMPRAAPLGSFACDSDTFRGRIPLSSGDCQSDEEFDAQDLEDWVEARDTEWILDNEWLEYVIYVVDEGCTESGSGCGGLTMNAHTNVMGILVGAGRSLSGQNRATDAFDTYLDLPVNTDDDGVYEAAPLSDEHNDVFLWR